MHASAASTGSGRTGSSARTGTGWGGRRWSVLRPEAGDHPLLPAEVLPTLYTDRTFGTLVHETEVAVGWWVAEKRAPLSDVERRDLLEVLEDRYDQCSTVITSQLPTKSWHQAIGDATIADAICDRLVHNAQVIALKGGSMRKKKAISTEATTENKN